LEEEEEEEVVWLSAKVVEVVGRSAVPFPLKDVDIDESFDMVSVSMLY